MSVIGTLSFANCSVVGCRGLDREDGIGVVEHALKDVRWDGGEDPVVVQIAHQRLDCSPRPFERQCLLDQRATWC